MNKKTLLATMVIFVAVIALMVVAVFALQNDAAESKEFKEVNATCTLSSLDGEETGQGFGNTIANILASAFPERDIQYSSNGNIRSVDGVANSGNKYWVVFKWASPDGWQVLSSAATTKLDLAEGVSLYLSYTERIVDEHGKITYAAPDLDIEYKVYFFLQFKEGYDANELIRSIMTEQERREGFWIEGTGGNVIECLADAVYTYLLPEDFSGDKTEVLSYDERRESFGWLNKFLGWEDKRISSAGGQYGTWTYWSQYRYDPDAETLDDADNWSYNEYSIGQYDITENHYFALILQTTTVENVNVPLPTTPAEIPVGL